MLSDPKPILEWLIGKNWVIILVTGVGIPLLVALIKWSAVQLNKFTVWFCTWLVRKLMAIFPKFSLRIYRRGIGQNFGTFEPLLKVVPGFPLKRIFVDVPLRLNDLQPSTTLLGAVSAHTRLLILGGAGSGKTTITKKLLLDINSKSKLGDFPNFVPVFLRLRNFAAEQQTLDEAIARELFPYARREEPLSKQIITFVESLKRKGKLLIILDGLDEVSGPSLGGAFSVNADARGQVVLEIERFCESLIARAEGCRIIITCRDSSYVRGELRDIVGLKTLNIEPFTDLNIREFLGGWPMWNKREANALWPKLQRNVEIKQVCSNPLLLSILAELFYATSDGKDFDLPLSRKHFFDSALIELLVNRPRSRKNIQNFDALEKRIFLQQVARVRCEGGLLGDRESIPRDVLLQEAGKLLKNTQTENVAKALIAELVEINSLLVPDVSRNDVSPSSFVFPHRTFFEFLAACDFATESTAQPLISTCSSSSDLFQVAVFYCAMSESVLNSESVIKSYVLAAQWHEAAECMAAAKHVSDERLVDDIITKLGELLITKTGEAEQPRVLHLWALLGRLSERADVCGEKAKAMFVTALANIFTRSRSEVTSKEPELAKALTVHLDTNASFFDELDQMLYACPKEFGNVVVQVLAQRGDARSLRSLTLLLLREGPHDSVRIEAVSSLDRLLMTCSGSELREGLVLLPERAPLDDWPLEDVLPSKFVARILESYETIGKAPESPVLRGAAKMREFRKQNGQAALKPSERRTIRKALAEWNNVNRSIRSQHALAKLYAIALLTFLTAFVLFIGGVFWFASKNRAPVELSLEGISPVSKEVYQSARNVEVSASKIVSLIQARHRIRLKNTFIQSNYLTAVEFEIFQRISYTAHFFYSAAQPPEWPKPDILRISRLAANTNAIEKFVASIDSYEMLRAQPHTGFVIITPPRLFLELPTALGCIVIALFILGHICASCLCLLVILKGHEDSDVPLVRIPFVVPALGQICLVCSGGSFPLRILPYALFTLMMFLAFRLQKLRYPLNSWKRTVIEVRDRLG